MLEKHTWCVLWHKETYNNRCPRKNRFVSEPLPPRQCWRTIVAWKVGPGTMIYQHEPLETELFRSVDIGDAWCWTAVYKACTCICGLIIHATHFLLRPVYGTTCGGNAHRASWRCHLSEDRKCSSRAKSVQYMCCGDYYNLRRIGLGLRTGSLKQQIWFPGVSIISELTCISLVGPNPGRVAVNSRYEYCVCRLRNEVLFAAVMTWKHHHNMITGGTVAFGLHAWSLYLRAVLSYTQAVANVYNVLFWSRMSCFRTKHYMYFWHSLHSTW